MGSLLYVPRDPATALVIVLYSRLAFSVCLYVCWVQMARLHSAAFLIVLFDFSCEEGFFPSQCSFYSSLFGSSSLAPKMYSMVNYSLSAVVH